MAGYPAASLFLANGAVVGARTTPSGLTRDGSPGDQFAPHTDIAATVTVLAEGSRGSLTQAYLHEAGITSPNPQIFALGVKELWEVPRPLDAVVHTMGWPLSRSAFGGSWLYPMADDLVSIGIVVGLDAPADSIDAHHLLQELKTHPMVRNILDGGKPVEWGAKTIPEGGFFSLPERLSGPGVVVVGDAAGFVNVPALKGIHYAMQSGILAGDAVFASLQTGSAKLDSLRRYDDAINASFIRDDLHRTRNMRLGFKSGFVRGSVKAAVATLSGGAVPRAMIRVESDAEASRQIEPLPATPAAAGSMSKLDGVFLADNATRDDVPSHLIAGESVDQHIAEFYHRMCPAGVYEWKDGRLVINAPNCIDCKATDVLGPRWTPREGGSGPSYRRM
jgi:electron-transferring-flavoprotein dehydrogenase